MSSRDELESVLDQLTDTLELARAVPLSSSCLINREETLLLVDDVRALLPEAVVEADQVLAERDALVEQGRQEAARLSDEGELLLEQARSEAERRVADGERALEQAKGQAELLLAEAEAERTRMVEADAVFLLARSQADALLAETHAEADALLTQAHTDADDMRRQTDDYVDAKLAQFEALLASTLTAVERGRSRLGGPTAADLDGRDAR